jgi:hypothetical protein
MLPPSESDDGEAPGSETTPDSAAPLDQLLPPPAFTPGGRKSPSYRHFQASSLESLIAHSGIPKDALISPDSPLRSRGDIPTSFEFDEEENGDGFEVEITGIGEAGSPYYDRGRTSFRGRLDVEEVARVLEDTARSLREDGPAIFLQREGQSRFESTLTGFIAGYFIGEGE